MNQNQKPKKRRGATAAAVLCFVAAIAIVGTYTLRDYRETQREEKLAQADDNTNVTKDKEDSEETGTKAEDIVADKNEVPETDNRKKDTTKDDTSADNNDEDNNVEENDFSDSSEVQSTGTEGAAGYFDSSSKLLWPVNGTVILGYSMDKTVYFSTLDQYKYNPAVIISGAEGDQVICGAPGIVKSIDVTAETGTTVNVDIGNGYELFYGQLKEVPVNVGDYVEAKSVLGYVSQPTKYYSVEGSNVYFEVRKDGQAVNPVDYLE